MVLTPKPINSVTSNPVCMRFMSAARSSWPGSMVRLCTPPALPVVCIFSLLADAYKIGEYRFAEAVKQERGLAVKTRTAHGAHEMGQKTGGDRCLIQYRAFARGKFAAAEPAQAAARRL